MRMINIDKSWTLFLDRDGVINIEQVGSYILRWEDFIFYEGVKEALQLCSQLFGRIIVVTNQRCIGKGLLTEEALAALHEKLAEEIALSAGRIDRIYFCGDLENSSPNRKPNTGMALQAKKEYPEIDFKRSVMIGNNISDMQFGKQLGMYTVFIASTQETPLPPHLTDMTSANLLAAVRQLRAMAKSNDT